MAYNVLTDLKRGDDILLYVLDSTYKPIAFATSCSVQVDGETIDTSNKMSGRWASNLAGRNSYTVSCDALYTKNTGHTSYDYLLSQMVSGNGVKWVMSSPSSADTTSFAYVADNAIASGTALITSLSLNAGNNEVASCSITLTGVGELSNSAPASGSTQ